MNNYSKEGLIFDHIQKTAGISLHEAFKKIFTSYFSLPQPRESVLHSHALEAYQYNYLGGHFEFSSGERLNPKRYYCTVLRDPFDRFLSHYFHCRQIGLDALQHKKINNPSLSDQHILSSVRWTLEEYVDLSHGPRSFLHNFQARHFARRVVSQPHLLNDRDLLDAAITSLEAYDLIGSFDNLSGFIGGLARDFRVEPVLLDRLNVTRLEVQRNQIPTLIKNKIFTSNSVDRKILDWASKRFSWSEELIPRIKIQPLDRVLPFNTKKNAHPKHLKFSDVKCFGEKSGSEVIGLGESILVNIRLIANEIVGDFTLGMAIKDKEGKLIYGINSQLLGLRFNIDTEGEYEATIRLKNILASGAYSLTLAIHKGLDHNEGCFEWQNDAAIFAVAPGDGYTFEGLVNCDSLMSLERIL